MPIYEYKAVEGGCEYCRQRFEIRQKITEPPLASCPQCQAPVRRLVSRPYICSLEPLNEDEKIVKRTEDEADKLGLIEGFAEDRIYE